VSSTPRIIPKKVHLNELAKVFSLDQVASDLIPTLIQIDVEGWESEVIRGGSETLRNPSLVALILELNESGERYGYFDNDFLEVLNDFGFQPHSYDPFRRTLQQLPGKNPRGGNTIFIKNREEVINKIRTAPKLKILRTWI
jgi:hypothetical protein